MPSGYQEETEITIAGIEAPIQIAYVHHDLEQKKVYFSYLGSPDTQIEDSTSWATVAQRAIRTLGHAAEQARLPFGVP